MVRAAVAGGYAALAAGRVAGAERGDHLRAVRRAVWAGADRRLAAAARARGKPAREAAGSTGRERAAHDAAADQGGAAEEDVLIGA